MNQAAKKQEAKTPLDRLYEKGAISAQQLHERRRQIVDRVNADLRARLTPDQRILYDMYYR